MASVHAVVDSARAFPVGADRCPASSADSADAAVNSNSPQNEQHQ